MKIALFGPPGSGKGTYASRLAPQLGIPHISTGDLTRNEIKAGTELGKKVGEYANRGLLVPDDIITEMLKYRLDQPDCKKGFILDGYPRTLQQARWLEDITILDVIVNLIVPEEILIEKISARRICKKCGDIYNIADIHKTIDGIEYIMPAMNPKKKGICDYCGGKLYQRDDDKPEAVRERSNVYEKQSKPVLGYYRGKIPFVDIHVTRGPEIMVPKILKELKKAGLK